MHDARGVVGDANLGGCDGEGGAVGTYNHVARQAEVTCTAPDGAADAGNDGNGRVLYGSQQLLHRYVVGQRVFAVLWQFADVVSSTPHAFVALCLDDNADTFLVIAFTNGIDQFVAHLLAQAIEVLRILHFDVADAVVDNGVY